LNTTITCYRQNPIYDWQILLFCCKAW
jgi:hypothetical protein